MISFSLHMDLKNLGNYSLPTKSQRSKEVSDFSFEVSYNIVKFGNMGFADHSEPLKCWCKSLADFQRRPNNLSSIVIIRYSFKLVQACFRIIF